MRVLKSLPNALTCGNLVCGCIGVVQVLQGSVMMGTYMIVLGGIFDFFDGFAARLTKSSSPIGKELDSLADMVTFGVLPSVIIFNLMAQATESAWLPYLAFFMAALSALRLAKFNVDTRQAMGFIGMPTPGNALFVGSLPYLVAQNTLGMGVYLQNYWVLLAIVVVMSLLLVAEVPMMAMKFKTYAWKDNKLKYMFMLFSLGMLAFFQIAAVPFVILVYVLVSWLSNRS
ncbi:MAG: CDP-diacylglycerol--serine O-phosphatidyltransferase [Cytophagales bacterium]|nr:CDP-diacylglycerol--serine O-phosphatidyltransferase [Cytophagales bacterium]